MADYVPVELNGFFNCGNRLFARRGHAITAIGQPAYAQIVESASPGRTVSTVGNGNVSVMSPVYFLHHTAEKFAVRSVILQLKIEDMVVNQIVNNNIVELLFIEVIFS